MNKLLIATALLFAVLPFTFDGVTPTVSKAHAVIGRPLTPFSAAGVHRRAVRRTFGVGANIGRGGFYRRTFAARRFHPVARAAVAGAALATGAAWGGGWGGWNGGWGGGWGGWGGGWGGGPGLYASAVAAPGWGGGWGGWGWQRPWRRGLYASVGAGPGWGGGWGGGGWGGWGGGWGGGLGGWGGGWW
jgi:hypothetical protein